MSAARAEFRAAFVSLKIPNYRVLWWGGVFSFMSVQMQFLLRGILAWDLTERESALGLVYLVFGLTMLIATPLGGVAADRFPRRTVLLFSQGALALGAALMGFAVLTDQISFWMVLVAGSIQGISFGFYGPARVAFAADLVGRDQLGNAITLSLLSMSATRIFAPALAGVLAGVAFVGIGGAYLISAAFSIASFISILRLPTIAIDSPSKRNPISDIAEGVRYVRRDRSLKLLVLTSFFVIMFGFNYVAFMPAMIKDIFDLGDSWLGIISSASAFGAVAVAVPLASRADSPKAKRVMAYGGMVFGGFVIVLGAAPNFWTAFAVVLLVGAATTTYQSLSNTLALQMSDNLHQGRVQSLMQLSFAGFGIASAPLGILAEAIGLRQTFMVMGAVALAASVFYFVAEVVGKPEGFGRVHPLDEPESATSTGIEQREIPEPDEAQPAATQVEPVPGPELSRS
jgi:MFS family permease